MHLMNAFMYRKWGVINAITLYTYSFYKHVHVHVRYAKKFWGSVQNMQVSSMQPKSLIEMYRSIRGLNKALLSHVEKSQTVKNLLFPDCPTF